MLPFQWSWWSFLIGVATLPVSLIAAVFVGCLIADKKPWGDHTSGTEG